MFSSIDIALLIVSWDFFPFRLAIKPIPHASCSKAASYSDFCVIWFMFFYNLLNLELVQTHINYPYVIGFYPKKLRSFVLFFDTHFASPQIYKKNRNTVIFYSIFHKDYNSMIIVFYVLVVYCLYFFHYMLIFNNNYIAVSLFMLQDFKLLFFSLSFVSDCDC